MNPCVETGTVGASKEGGKMDSVYSPYSISESSSAIAAAEGL